MAQTGANGSTVRQPAPDPGRGCERRGGWVLPLTVDFKGAVQIVLKSLLAKAMVEEVPAMGNGWSGARRGTACRSR